MEHYSYTAAHIDPGTGAQSVTDTRLGGGWLLCARIVTVGPIVLALGAFVLSSAARFAQLLTIAKSLRGGLAQLGLAPDFLWGYMLALDIAVMCACLMIALALLVRRSHEWMALLAALALVIYGLWITRPVDLFDMLSPAILFTTNCLWALGLVCALLSGLLFPSGRFVPRWTRLLALLWTLLVLAWLVFVTINQGNPARTPPVGWLFFPVVCSAGLVVQVYRYLRVSTPTQRQQTKWMVLGAASAAVGVMGFSIPGLIFAGLRNPGLPRVWYLLIGLPVYNGLLLLFPLAIGLALLRFRLWDIDLIINRTLVYGVLTGTLGAIYLGSVGILQYLLSGLTGQTSPFSIVGSTLLIAVLFQPLHSSIQTVIERRFYRSKYDAARTLAAFSERLRDEVDLEQLSEQLVKVVNETMQPTRVSLWLRPIERERTTTTRPLDLRPHEKEPQ